MMFKIALFAFSAAVLVTAISFHDCVPEGHGDERVVSVNILKVTPGVITFPGTFNVSVNLTFSRNVTEPFVDFELVRYFLGFPLKLPCSGSSVVGSCNNIPICDLFNRTIFDKDHQDSYGHKLQRLMNATTGHVWKCPIPAQNVYVDNKPFNMTDISPLIHLLADGDYRIKVQARENKTGPIIGCIIVNATIGGQGTGSIFG